MRIQNIRVPKGLRLYKATTPQMKKLEASMAYNLSTARLAATSTSDKLSWAYAAAHDAAQLMLAHFGYCPVERIRRDTASLAGVAVLAVGTELADLARQLGSLLSLRNAVHHSGFTKVSSEEAEEALSQAERFCTLATSIAAQSIRIPLATSCGVGSQQAAPMPSSEHIQIPLHILGSALDLVSVAPERWIALRTNRVSYGIDREPVNQEHGPHVILDCHRALPCNGDDVGIEPDDPVMCVFSSPSGLQIAWLRFGYTTEMAHHAVDDTFQLPDTLEDAESSDAQIQAEKSLILEDAHQNFIFDLAPKLDKTFIIWGAVVCFYDVMPCSERDNLLPNKLEINLKNFEFTLLNKPARHERKTTDEQDTAMCVLWEKGWYTFGEIAKQFGISATTVRSRIIGESESRNPR